MKSKTDKYNIVIIDDEPNVIKVITKILGDETYNYKIFNSGVDALDYIKKHNDVDLILCDINMPRMNGLQFIEEVRNMVGLIAIPVIFITGVSDDGILEEAMSLGAIDYLGKPINSVLLKNKVKSLLTSLTLSSLNQSLLLESKSGDMNIEELINYCEVEKVDGFATVCKNDGDLEIITFRRGHLENLYFNGDENIESFDIVKNWKNFEIKVYNLPYRTFLIDLIKKNSFNNNSKPNNKNKELQMNLKEKLNGFKDIDGFAGAGVYSPKGETMAVLEGSDLHAKLNTIGVLASNVLTFAQKSTVEMGAGKGRMVHIVGETADILAKSMWDDKGNVLFHIVLVLNEDTGIGMAKMRLDSIAEDIFKDFQ